MIKLSDTINQTLAMFIDETKRINQEINDSVQDAKICNFIYARCHGIIPRDQNEIEIYDPIGYRVALEKQVRQLLYLNNCATYIYLEVPRNNPKNHV